MCKPYSRHGNLPVALQILLERRRGDAHGHAVQCGTEQQDQQRDQVGPGPGDLAPTEPYQVIMVRQPRKTDIRKSRFTTEQISGSSSRPSPVWRSRNCGRQHGHRCRHRHRHRKANGFAGGGLHIHEDTRELVLGSPFVFLEAAKEAQALVAKDATNPCNGTSITGSSRRAGLHMPTCATS